MKYSFIVAAYNIENYIHICLESLSKINFNSAEFIVVNDGSTDGTKEIINKFTKLDNRFIQINKDNGGLVRARKSGLKIASGKYIIFIDGDDYVIPNAFHTIDKALDDFDPELLVFRYFKEILGKKVKSNLDKKEIIYSNKKVFMDKSSNEALLSTYLWNKVFLKSKLDLIYPFINNEITIGEDAAVTFPYYLSSVKKHLIDSYFYVYRQHQSSMLKNTFNPSLEISKLQYLRDSFIKTINKKFNQIDSFIKSLLVVRLGGFYSVDSKNVEFIVKQIKGKMVVIFSTGNFGQKISNYNKQFNYFFNVGFIDPDQKESKRLGFNMVELTKLQAQGLDFVFIASLNKDYINDSIRLLEKYVPKNKIKYVTRKDFTNFPFERYFNNVKS
jgi:glycosyltransferase involved in cell wall biosynthesis